MQIAAKPKVVTKLKQFHDYIKANGGRMGHRQRGIDMNLNNACNLRCKHCFTNSPKAEGVKERLDLDVIRSVANQADDLGFFEWDMQGGELLLQPRYLFEALEAMDTSRFYTYLTTNGFFMTPQIATDLKDLGVDRVSVSIDSMDPHQHDTFRGRKESWKKGMQALEMVQAAGISPYLNITVGRFNAMSEDVEMLMRYSKDHRYTTLVNVATPSGMWQKLDEIMVNEEDKAWLIAMRKKYRNVLRNLWDPFDRDYEGVIGCNTVNRLYITPTGDVLPCPYVHIRIGNVKNQSLKEISEYGFSLRPFGTHSSLCLAGEDREFVAAYMSRPGTSIFKPVDAKEVFSEDDYLPVPTLPARPTSE